MMHHPENLIQPRIASDSDKNSFYELTKYIRFHAILRSKKWLRAVAYIILSWLHLITYSFRE